MRTESPTARPALPALLAVACIALLASCAARTLSPVGRSHPAAMRPAAPPIVAASSDASPAPPAPVVPTPLASGRLPDLARPLRYALRLEVDPRAPRFAGEVAIDVDVPRPTRVVVLHARELRITSVEITPEGEPRGAVPIAATWRSRDAAGAPGGGDELVLTTPREVPAGRARIALRWSSAWGADLRGLYRLEHHGRWYAYTQFQPMDARRALPCFDEPAFKTPWEVTLDTPDDLRAFSNMPEVRAPTDPRTHRTEHVFAPTPPTSSYLVAAAVGPFEVIEGARAPVPIRLIAPQGAGALARFALDAAEAHLRILTEWFGRPFPYPKLDLVAVPDMVFAGMEHPGMVTFLQSVLLIDPRTAPASERRWTALTIAHELSHHWFGDMVTMDWWDDLWLNEGFATFMQSRVVERWDPTYGARVTALNGRNLAMRADAEPGAHAVRRPIHTGAEAVSAFDGITYDKGAAVLEMLEAWLGDEVFHRAVLRYLAAHEWSSATAADLFTALAAAAPELPVESVARSFLDRPGVPLVSVELECSETRAPTLRLAQSRYRPLALDGAREGSSAAPGSSATPAGERWEIPVCVLLDDHAAPRRMCTVLRDESARVPVLGAQRCPRWMHPNPGETGYYRYTMPPLARAAARPSMLSLVDARTRAGYLQNAWALLWGGGLDAEPFVELLESFRWERDPRVLLPLTSALIGLRDALTDDAARPDAARYVREFLVPVRRALGWDPQPGESFDVPDARAAVLDALGRAGETRTLLEAERRALTFLRAPAANENAASFIALPLASRRAEVSRVQVLLAAMTHAGSAAQRTAMESALVTFVQPAPLRAALDTLLAAPIAAQSVLPLLERAADDPARRPVVLAWTREHYAPLVTRTGPAYEPGFVGLWRGACSRAEIADVHGFWDARARGNPAAVEQLDGVLRDAARCAAVRERVAPRLRALLHPAADAGTAGGPAAH